MSNNDKRLQMIGSVILSEAKKDSEKVKESADKLCIEELKEYEEAMTYSMFGIVQKETASLRQNTVEQIAQSEVNARGSFFEKRKDLEKSLFSSVEKHLVEYCLSEDYRNTVFTSLTSIRDSYDHSFSTLEIHKSLGDNETQIKKILPECKINISNNILIGGWKLTNSKAKIHIDETMDSRLEKEKEWFYKDSDLTLG